MANATVAQAVNRQTVALQEARKQAAEHQAWLNAINKAALYLSAEQWAFDGETLVIMSATTDDARYLVTVKHCECRAFKRGIPCWHRAAVRLLEKTAEVELAPTGAWYKGSYYSAASLEASRHARESLPSMADLQADVDELVA
jgi:hypothetical protein